MTSRAGGEGRVGIIFVPYLFHENKCDTYCFVKGLVENSWITPRQAKECVRWLPNSSW